MMKYSKAFTLLELLIVIIIIAILAILMIPSFKQAREATLNDEARSNLKLIKATLRDFHMQNGYYYNNTAADCEGSINLNLRTSLQVGTARHPKRWNYSIAPGTTGPAGNPYRITAYRNAGTGYERTLWLDYEQDQPQCESGGFCK